MIKRQQDLFDRMATKVSGDVPEALKRERAALETGRNRLALTGLVLALGFAVIGYRVVDLTLLTDRDAPRLAQRVLTPETERRRADIIDRNGVVLATSLPTVSLYADPKKVLDAEEAADRLARALPGLDRDVLISRLTAKGRFVYLKRGLTPAEHFAAHRLGIPGVWFERGEQRVYPHGRLASHVLGATDVDSRGLGGVEKRFDAPLNAGGSPVQLSLDIRVQSIVRSELRHAIDRFSAIGGMAAVMDANTSEIIAMVSMPDFDPHKPGNLLKKPGFNRMTKGVYEMGSSFKLLTAAMALDAGVVGLSGGYDATKPIRLARYTIKDFKPKNRWLSLPEILVHSSNIGAAKMALDLGAVAQKTYLGRLGLLRPSPVELPEVGRPLQPPVWREINTATISFGHGLSVSPLQLVNGVATVVNGGFYRPATLIKVDPDTLPDAPANRVFSSDTSAKMRGLMRLVVSRGTGRNADVDGYLVGGKTGTAEKLKNGRYQDGKNIVSFVGAFPIHDPRYVIMVAVDEPKGRKDTYGYATGGWVAAPAVKRVITRMAGVLGVPPAVGIPELTAERKLVAPGVAAARFPGAPAKPKTEKASLVTEETLRAAVERAETRERGQPSALAPPANGGPGE